MLWRPRHLPSSLWLKGRGTNVKQEVHKAQYTGSTPANKGSHGRLKGTGMGRDTAVGHPPSPHLMALGFPDQWMVSLRFKMRYDHVSQLCNPVTLLVFTTPQQAVPQFNYVIQNNSFFLFSPCPLMLHWMFSGTYIASVSPSPATCTFQTFSTSVLSYLQH